MSNQKEQVEKIVKMLNEEKIINEVPKIKKQNIFQKIFKPNEQLIDTVKTHDEQTIIKLYVKRESVFDKLFNRYEGKLLYSNVSGKYISKNIKNFKDLEKFEKSAYLLHKIEGNLDGKPFFMLKNGIPININTQPIGNLKNKLGDFIKNGIDLCYNSRMFYTLLNYVNIANLTAQEENNMMEWLKKNWYIVVIIVIVVLLSVTPQGQELMKKFYTSMIPKR